MSIKTAIVQAFRILYNPEKEFENLEKRSLESVVEDYLKLILLTGLVAGIIAFLVIVISSAYLDIFKGITINYLHLLNYAGGILSSTFFFYLFSGTFIFFILTVIIWLFVRKIKYFELIGILCYAFTPIIIFSWISVKTIFPLVVWSLFLLITGIIKHHQLRANKNTNTKLRKKK